MSKMSIKEAGRYANFLNERILELSHITYSGINSRLEEVTEVHKKSKANPEAEDESRLVEFQDLYDVTPEKALEVLEVMLDEKTNLAIAISKAKSENLIEIKNRKIDIDSAIESSKLLRSVSEDFFYPLLDRNDKVEKINSTAYAFNVEGNQVPYVYETEITRKLQYDKKHFIEKKKEILLRADKLSIAVDGIMNSHIVEFKPQYSYLDNLEDLLK